MNSLADIDPANVVDIDFAGAGFKTNARKHLYDWATRPPFYVLNNGPAQVIVGRYADVQEVFNDPERFSSEMPRGPGYEQFDKFMGGKFLTLMDGEQHSRLRRLMMPAFAPTRIAQMESRIAAIIDGFLDDIERKSPQFDGMADYASRLVVGALLTAILGLNDEQKKVLIE